LFWFWSRNEQKRKAEAGSLFTIYTALGVAADVGGGGVVFKRLEEKLGKYL
jgi:hypothetical protein